MEVNGHELPAELVSAVRAGWIARVDRAGAEQRLGVNCGYLRFFELDYLVGRLADDWLVVPAEYRGAPSDTPPPGDIDPAMSIVVGEVDDDCPLVVDFRTSPPSVAALAGPGWIRIAADVSGFLDKLDPDRSLRDRAEGR